MTLKSLAGQLWLLLPVTKKTNAKEQTWGWGGRQISSDITESEYRKYIHVKAC